MKAWKIEYSMPATWQNDYALVLAQTANQAIKKLRVAKHVGGTRIISVQRQSYDEIIK